MNVEKFYKNYVQTFFFDLLNCKALTQIKYGNYYKCTQVFDNQKFNHSV